MPITFKCPVCSENFEVNVSGGFRWFDSMRDPESQEIACPSCTKKLGSQSRELERVTSSLELEVATTQRFILQEKAKAARYCLEREADAAKINAETEKEKAKAQTALVKVMMKVLENNKDESLAEDVFMFCRDNLQLGQPRLRY